MTQDQAFFKVLPFRFDGNATEYFKIWIVNICLTIFTLGIYSAWAKVRTLRYFYGNTILDEHHFSYLAEPIQILKGRIIAVFLLVVYLLSWEFYPSAGFWFLAFGVLILPAIMVLALSFNMNNSAYRNIRFAFKRDFKKVYLIFVIPLLIVLVLTWLGFSLLESADFVAEMEQQEDVEFKKEDLLPTVFFFSLLPLIPYLDCIRTRFIVDQTRFGKTTANFEGTAGQFYGLYFITFLFFMFIGFVSSFIIGIAMVAMGASGSLSEENTGMVVVVTVFTMIIFYGLSFFVMAYLRAARTNLIFNKTKFGDNSFNSKLKTLPIAWLYISNTIGIIFSAGLLIPWSQIRMARYVADNTEFEAKTLEDIIATQDNQQGAFGEEFGDAFDIDIGL